jgi:hypothetical protein
MENIIFLVTMGPNLAIMLPVVKEEANTNNMHY